MKSGSIVAGPNCNSSKCRENTSAEFYEKTTMIFVSPYGKSPDDEVFTIR